MGSEFLERNKRKTGLAGLLLLLSGKGRYFAVLVVAAAVSMPFLLTGERMEKLMSFPAVSAALRAVGLTEPQAADLTSKDLAMSAQSESRQASFWDRFLRAVNAPLPPAKTTTSTMAMLRGSLSSAGPVVVNEEKGTPKPGPGKVAGVVNAEERARGDAPGGVDLQGLVGAGQQGGGLDGDTMAQELGDRYGSAGPYANRAVLSGPGGASDRYGDTQDKIMNDAAAGVPVPGSPQSLKGRTGKVSGFSWRNTKTSMARSGARAKGINTKRSIDRLSEAFTMAGMAFGSSTPEYESAYSGAVFDGNPVDANLLLSGDAIVPAVPSTAFAESMLASAQQTIADAEKCTKAGAEGGKKVEELGAGIKKVQDTMDPDNPPSNCCAYDKSARKKWNRAIEGDSGSSDPAFKKGLRRMCDEMNEENKKMADACPATPAGEYKPIDCQQYSDMHIDCSWWDCFVELFTWLTLGALIVTVWVIGAVTGWYDLGTPHEMVRGITNWIMGNDKPEMPDDPGTGPGTGSSEGKPEKVEDLSGKS